VVARSEKLVTVRGQRGRYSDWLRAGLPKSWSSSPGREKNVHFSMSSRPVLGPTWPPIKWVPRSLSPEVKRPGSEAEHSPPTRVEVKKTSIYAPTPHSPSRSGAYLVQQKKK
jgi:hypothetical protein